MTNPLPKFPAIDDELDTLFELDAPTTPSEPSQPHLDYPDDALVVVGHEPTPNAWPPKLLMDLALGVDDLHTILARYEMPVHVYNAISDNLHFRKELVALTKELHENGVTFKRKAALQAEMYLVDMDIIMADIKTPPSVKTDIFKTMARLGELEPEKKTSDTATGPAFNIQINL